MKDVSIDMNSKRVCNKLIGGQRFYVGWMRGMLITCDLSLSLSLFDAFYLSCELIQIRFLDKNGH